MLAFHVTCSKSLVARSAAATLFAAPLTQPQEVAQRWP